MNHIIEILIGGIILKYSKINNIESIIKKLRKNKIKILNDYIKISEK